MSHLVIFPWIDREEVRNVYNELFSKNVMLQKHAVGRITVWKCRSMNRLPSAVESTMSFINAQIARQSEGLETVEMDFQLRSMYSMALIRFVNHITERGQQGTYARPVHVIASEVGVPEWIVELRHDATHGSLPSLSELEAATSWALQWLREKFWEPQMAETFGVSSLRCAASEMLKDSLVKFMQRKFQEKNGGEVISCKQVLTDIEHVFEQLGSIACSVLIEDGYLVFTEDQLKCLGYSYADLKSSGSLLLPAELLQFWKKVIHLLVKSNLVSELVLHMASVVTESPSLRNTVLYSWIYTLVWHNKKKKSKKGQPILFKRHVDMPLKRLLEKFLQFANLNANANSLLNLLVDNADIDLEQKQQLKQLLSICKTSPKNTESSSVQKIHTIKDISSEIKSTSQKSWSKCTEPVVWSKYPVGILPDQMLDYRSFELTHCLSAPSLLVMNDISEECIEEAMDEISSNSMEEAENVYADESSVTCSKEMTDSFNVFQWGDRVKQNIADQIQLF